LKKHAIYWRNAVARGGLKAVKAHLKEAGVELTNAALVKVEVDELIAAPTSTTGEVVKTASRPFLFSDWDSNDFRKSTVSSFYFIFTF
jgi:hypothetical protein